MVLDVITYPEGTVGKFTEKKATTGPAMNVVALLVSISRSGEVPISSSQRGTRPVSGQFQGSLHIRVSLTQTESAQSTCQCD